MKADQRALLTEETVRAGGIVRRIGGEQRYAMRIWLDRQALAAQALVLPATVLLSWGLIGRVMGFHAAGGRS